MGLCFSMPGTRNYKKVDASSLAVAGELQSRIEEAVSTITSNDVGSMESAVTDGLGTLVELSETFKNDPDLFQSVKEYLSTADEVLKDVLVILKECIAKAHQAEEILAESREYFRLRNYEQTAKELRDFMAFEDPFGSIKESIAKLRSACEKQKPTLEKLLQKYRDEIGSMRLRRSLGIAAFAVVLVAALICTVVVAALPVAATVVAVVGAAAGALGGLGPIMTAVWPDKVGEWSSAEEAIKIMEDESFGTKTELTDIRTLVENLQGQIKSVKSTCKERLPKVEDVRMWEDLMAIIRRKLPDFSESLKDLEKRVDRCRKQIEEKKKEMLGKTANLNHSKLPWHKRMIRSCSCCR